MTTVGCHQQRCEAAGGDLVYVRSFIREQTSWFQFTLTGSKQQRREAVLCLGAYVGAVLDQFSRDLQMTLLQRPHQSSLSLLVFLAVSFCPVAWKEIYSAPVSPP